jgi:hypothetical protein
MTLSPAAVQPPSREETSPHWDAIPAALPTVAAIATPDGVQRQEQGDDYPSSARATLGGATIRRKQCRKARRESSPFQPHPDQLDLISWLASEAKQEDDHGNHDGKGGTND